MSLRVAGLAGQFAREVPAGQRPQRVQLGGERPARRAAPRRARRAVRALRLHVALALTWKYIEKCKSKGASVTIYLEGVNCKFLL